MKVHIKYIYYYKFETKLLLITNKNYENWESQSSFTWRSMEGGCNVYVHSSLWMRPTGEWSINAKMVYTTKEKYNTNTDLRALLTWQQDSALQSRIV